MKRTTLMLILLSYFAFSQAQVRLSLTGGFTVATQTVTMENNGDTRYSTDNSVLGFQGGLLADCGRGPVRFQTGLVLMQKGSSYTEDNGDQWNYTYNYLQIPLYAKFRYGFGPGHLYFTLGPSYCMTLSGKANNTTAGSTQTLEIGTGIDNNGNPRLSDHDLTLDFGVGVKFQRLSFGVTYSWGLLSANSYSESDGTNVNTYNRSTSLYIALDLM
jgi:hypothetical protein